VLFGALAVVRLGLAAARHGVPLRAPAPMSAARAG